jgi:glycosyltransferase involved in cell wall biosynthesis
MIWTFWFICLIARPPTALKDVASMSRFVENRIVVIHGNDGTDVRVGKVCRSLCKLGFDVHFIGWDRRPHIAKTVDLGATKTHIMQNPTKHGRASILGTVSFARHIATSLRKLRPLTACCVNEDNAFLALPLRGVYFRYLVCDVFDALWDRHSHRLLPLRLMLGFVATFSRAGADRLIATDAVRHARFGRYMSKCVIVCNYPEDPGQDLACTHLEGPVRVYAAGTMYSGRGLHQLLRAVDATEGVEIVSAGWLNDDHANNVFAQHPKVTFHGIVTAERSLELAAQCDAIFSFYEPKSVGNFQASPNKIYDAMSVGRPVIINKEAGISKWIVENNLGFCLSYNDVHELTRVLDSLKARRATLPEFAEHARQLFNQGYSWDRMESRLGELYNGFIH